jgi:hypothetical protein
VPRDYPGARRSAWPWVLGLVVLAVVVVAGMGIAAAVLVPRMMRSAANTNARNSNLAPSRRFDPNWNGNRNSNSSDNENWNANENADVENTTPPPTDATQVLTQLTDLEHEWTVANINADKKKLNRILADDYVGITNGRSQGKAEYLKTIERDTSIQHWEFKNLRVDLNNDRASIRGVIQLDLKNQNGEQQELSFNFVDKFVWRDGRWQATASEVSAVPGSETTN